MLNKLIKEYVATRISYEMAGSDPTNAVIEVLKKIDGELTKNKYKCDPTTIENKAHAMIVFFEMFARKIGGDMVSFCCYYFASLVANDMSLPLNNRITGNMYRAFITFKNMEKWDILMGMARTAPMNGYSGHLDGNSFFDLLLLSDVYQAWNADSDSPMLENLKRQAPAVASNHPQYTKDQVILEGKLAHKAVFNVIKTLVTIPQF